MLPVVDASKFSFFSRFRRISDKIQSYSFQYQFLSDFIVLSTAA